MTIPDEIEVQGMKWRIVHADTVMEYANNGTRLHLELSGPPWEIRGGYAYMKEEKAGRKFNFTFRKEDIDGQIRD